MNLIKLIADHKINQALIVEDDVVIDYKKLEKINLDKLPQDSLIYFGVFYIHQHLLKIKNGVTKKR